MSPFVFEKDPRCVATAGAAMIHIGKEVSTREDLFDHFAAELAFPDYFGHNWDAFDECLRDLHWVRENRVSIIHEDLPELTRQDTRVYLEILARAVQNWREDDRHEFLVAFPEHARRRVQELMIAEPG